MDTLLKTIAIILIAIGLITLAILWHPFIILYLLVGGVMLYRYANGDDLF